MASDGLFLGHDERYVQTGEFMAIWTALARGETVNFEGKHLSIKNGRLLFPFVQKPYAPIYFGGSSEIARDLAAEHVDVYLAWASPSPT